MSRIYQAEANVTFQPPSIVAGAANLGQYLDSQVLLLESRGVAQQAANIANGELGGKSWMPRTSTAATATGGRPANHGHPGRVWGHHRRGVVQGPESRNRPGRSNAILQAYRQSRIEAIRPRPTAQSEGINKAISQTAPSLRAALETQRTQAWSTSRLT